MSDDVDPKVWPVLERMLAGGAPRHRHWNPVTEVYEACPSLCPAMADEQRIAALETELKSYKDEDVGVLMTQVSVLKTERARLQDDLDTWNSVFPDIAPESVLPDRSKLEEHAQALRELVEEADELMVAMDNTSDYQHMRTAASRWLARKKEVLG